jgi:alcohol dehydrogenase
VRSTGPGSRPRLTSATHQLDGKRFATHHFGIDGFMEAYNVFSNASETGALKVVLTRGP